ncbi:MAG: FecR family protein [Aestuariibaculum sp.]
MIPSKIEHIITKYLSNSVTTTEEEQLSQWLEDATNKLYFKDYVKTNYAITYSISNPDTKTALHNILKQTKPKVIGLPLIKYAAAVVVFIAVGIGAYTYFYNEEAVTNRALLKIKPGYNKATLVLFTGDTLNLETHKNQIITKGNSIINNNDRVLEYNNKTVDREIDPTYIPKFNTLFVPVGGMYQIKLPDGTRVWLNSATSLKFPERFVGNYRDVTLEGEAYFDVTKSSKPFIVRTPTADVTVLGTEFNISSYAKDPHFSATLVEGKIKLTSVINNASEELIPSQRAVILKGDTKINLTPIETEIYTSWKEGKFYFERETLEQILTKMERWYNVDITFEDSSIKTETFTGVAYKDKPIGHLLDMICKTTKLNYKITTNKKTKKYEIIVTR